MVTSRKIRCVVVVASPENLGMLERDDLPTDPHQRADESSPSRRLAASSNRRPATPPRFRPSDLLPWADPHIRSLVEQLQDEVREEEAARRAAATPADAVLRREPAATSSAFRGANRLDGIDLAPLGPIE